MVARPTAPDRLVHFEGAGVLSASSGQGGQSIYPPPPPPWTASFGTLLLCVNKSGQRVRIEAVRAEPAPTPLALRHMLRVVPPKAARPPGFSWPSYYSAIGAFPGKEKKPYGGVLRPVEGAVVDQPCAEVRSTSDRGYTDLLTELTVDRRGSKVTRTYVDYTSGGRRYTLVIRWEMTACGTAISEHCGQ